MKSILIANRGEIAVRILRAAKDLGLRTIAIYSELDRDAVHTAMADEAWNVGPAPAADSYLNEKRILEIAKEANADAIHPGYGFLAENAGFAQAVIDAGIIWIGPPPDAISMMGDKIESRVAAERADVRGVPGTLEALTSAEQVADFAAEHGFPVAIKAAAGGGGRGLKVVREASGLDDAFEAAGREAEAWFGNAAVYVERYLENARHIEAQVLFDNHGNGVFLGERDCSLQRRHQKLLEECPAPNFSPDDRSNLGELALALGHAAGYRSAGTVEFLFADGEFYFLEMNTRIQVEHTITEEVFGVDLVAEQIRIAMGEPLSMTTTPAPVGHAMEFRINAEDPSREFMPNPGTLVTYVEPGGPGVRVDSGVVAGSTISQYYDNMIAKLIVTGPDRESVIARARRALREYDIGGVDTTIPAHLQILDDPHFLAGEVTTRLVEDSMDFSQLDRSTSPTLPENEEMSERAMTVEVGGKRFTVKYWAKVMTAPGSGKRIAPRRKAPKLPGQGSTAGSEGALTAPMQGTIVKIHKKAGESVEAGEAVCVLEAMKMENEIKAPAAGEIVDLRVQVGDAVSPGTILMVIK
ncbi:MAG: acetyl/propionyl/methylcrotonyl-CoA carboxylase subunit alpha [Acidimicrobiia bacterium]|nr:MAG: acetyl/propionyl/methylcrotonyl-CoA carboxylase subunit alpha [Acidimicrobiia bacterium]